MGIKDQDDDELKRFLDKDDLIDFEKEQSIVRSLWQNQPLVEERKFDSRLESQPPIKLYVGKIPPGLSENGLRNYFNKYLVLSVDLLKGAGGDYNFGFVTLASPKKAEEAIRALNGAPPLHLTVNYARSKKSSFDDLEKQMQEWQLNFDSKKPEVVEENWDQEIKDEEEMFESLDKFREDYSSDDDLNLNCKTKDFQGKVPPVNDEMPPSSVEGKVLKPPCKRCGKESMFQCGKCSKERYCSQACQSLDWYSHKAHCLKDLSTTVDVGQNGCRSEADGNGVNRFEEPPSSLKDESKKCTYFEKDLAPCKVVDVKVCELLDVFGKWALIKPINMALDVDAAIMKELLEDEVLQNLHDSPKEGQLALTMHQKKVIRVVVDQIYDDGCLGIRGLDVQVTQKLPNFQLLHAFPKALTHFPSKLVSCKLQSNHSIKKDDIGANFKLKFLEMKKKYPLIELTRPEVVDKVALEEELNLTSSPPGTPVVEKQKVFEKNGWDDSFICSGTPLNSRTREEPTYVTINDKEASRMSILSPILNPATSSHVSSSSSNSSSWRETPNTELSLKIQEVYVLHNEGPTEVYVTPSLKILKNFQRYMYKTGSSLDFDPMFSPGIGEMVLARSRSDKYWYRALVTDISERVTFWCPDFGFSESVYLKDLREINKRLAPFIKKNSYLACKCVLMDWRKGTLTATKEEIKDIKKRLPVSEDPIKVNVICIEDSKYVIDVKYLCRS